MPEPTKGWGLTRDDFCHCGERVHVYEDGFTRVMCEECSTIRCDIEPGPCPRCYSYPAPQVTAPASTSVAEDASRSAGETP